MSEPDVSYRPSAEYRYWLYDGEGEGMTYYRSAEERDKAAATAVALYLDEGWDEEVELVSAGEVTHFAQCLNKKTRPPAEEIDDEGCDGEGQAWGDCQWIGSYAMEPLQ